MRFEKVSLETFMKDMKKHGFRDGCLTAYSNIKIPERKTRHSAGYDVVTPVDFVLHPGEQITIPTGIKAYFAPEEMGRYHLQLFVRSSVGIQRGVVMSNQTGIIDADFYNNEDNEGDMLIALRNMSDNTATFKAGDRIIQAVWMAHYTTDDDHAEGVRTGGVGSTDKCNDDYCEIGG